MMDINKTIRTLLCAICMTAMPAMAQNVALKTNTLYYATATPNLAVEIGLDDQWTLDIGAAYKPFKLNDEHYARFWFAQPEARYWFARNSRDTLLASTPMAASSIADGTTPSMMDTSPARVYPMATTGYSHPIGTWKPPSV